MRINIEIGDIEAFIELTETNSFAKAAIMFKLPITGYSGLAIDLWSRNRGFHRPLKLSNTSEYPETANAKGRIHIHHRPQESRCRRHLLGDRLRQP